MPGMFCRHNRLTANCPICSKELEAQLPKAPPRVRAPASRSGSRPARQPRTSGVVTRRVARAADDGYRNPLTPGLRASADAERLAAALSAAAARLEPPGPYPEIATEPNLEDATWLAFLLALAGPEAVELQDALRAAPPRWADGVAPDLPPERARTAAAYRAWVQRAGTQAAAFTGESVWTPERRFGRLFERLALPGFGRARRFDLLTALGSAGVYDLQADGLHFVEDDAATLAAKRLLVSGDSLLLDRRARELADACAIPLAALDRGLAAWGTPGMPVDLTAEVSGAVRAALQLR
jgi:alpha-glutamyl/putrescinyl thymine pyrophosphorylase-like protein